MKRIGLILTIFIALICLLEGDVFAKADVSPAVPQLPPRPTSGRIQMRGFDFDPVVEGVSADLSRSVNPTTEDGMGLFIVQLNAVTTDAIIDQLQADMQLVQYIPHEAYIVWSSQSALDNAASRSSVIRWTAPYFTALRVEQSVFTAAKNVQLEALILNEATLAPLQQLIATHGGSIIFAEHAGVMDGSLAASLVNFTIDAAAIPSILLLPGLISLDRYVMPETHDETSANFVAVQDATDDYPRWLAMTGYDGSGVRVAINDTGVDWDHADLQNVQSGQDFSSIYTEANEPGSDGSCDQTTPRPVGDAAPCLGNEPGHGTHVAGIVAGTGASGSADDGTGNFPNSLYGVGVAPGATLHAANSIASGGTGFSYNNLAQNQLGNNVSLSNNSYGGSAGQGYTGSARSIDVAAIDSDTSNDVTEPFLWVFSAGNSGNGNNGACPVVGGTNFPCINSIGSPGTGKNVITVGSSSSPRSTNPDNDIDSISGFSSRGQNGTARTTRIKPDIVAAGDRVINTENVSVGAGGVLNTSCGAGSAPNSTAHNFCSGTSMAAPQIAGVAALFTQFWREFVDDAAANPAPATVKAAMIATADDMVGGDDGWGNTLTNRPNPHQGWGRINADRLLNPPLPTLYYENPVIFDDTGDEWVIRVTPYNSFLPMHVALVWSDPAGAAGATNPLVNDLSMLVLREPQGGGSVTVYCGNDFSNGVSVNTTACNNQTFDQINNVEVAYLPATNSIDTYTIAVGAIALNGDGVHNFGDMTDQHFSLVCYNCVERYYVDDTVDDDLAGYWRFDEGTGSTAYDLSGRGNHLAMTDGSYTSSNVTAGGSTNYNTMAFNGSTSIGFKSSPDVSITDEFSISMLVQRESGGSHFLSNLLRYDDVRLYWNGGSSGTIVAEVRDASGTNTFASFTPGTPYGNWMRVTATWHKDGYLRLYEYNTLMAEVESNGVAASLDSSAALSVGGGLRGWMDNIYFFEKVLKEPAITRLVAGNDCETDGASWHTAFRFLQCAIQFVDRFGAGHVSDIYVAEGTYTPGTNRNASFNHANLSGRNRMRIYGGYAGTYDNYRNVQAYPTYLNGDIDDNDLTVRPIGHNSYTLVTDTGNGLWLSGFTIEGGLADGGSGATRRGGGVYSDGQDGTYEYLTFRNNEGELGGSFYTTGGSPTIYQSMFVNNRAGDFGGALYNLNSSTSIIGSVFSGNISDNIGGALMLSGNNGANITIEDSTFHYNYATGTAGSGALWAQTNANLDISNSILWGNNPSGTQQTVNTGSVTITIDRSIVEGGWSGAGGDNLATDPSFIDPIGADGQYGTIDDNLRIRQGSPAVDSGLGCSIFKFTSEAHIDGDRDGTAQCDRGAYEFGTVLVVDDDEDDPDNLKAYTDALDALDVEYDVFDDQSDSFELPADYLQAYRRAIWFTGAYEPGDGPESAEETQLAAWLDSPVGDCFFISSQDYQYLSDTAFMSSHLGMASRSEDVEYESVAGAAGSIFSGVDVHTLAYRTGVNNYTDQINPDGTATTVFTSDGNSAGIHKQTGNYVTTYLGFPLENLPSADVETVLGAFLADCDATIVPTAVVVSGQAVVDSEQWLVLLFAVVGLLLTTSVVMRRSR